MYKRVLISHFITDSSAKLNRNPNSVPENIGDLLSDSASSAKVFLVYFFEIRRQTKNEIKTELRSFLNS